MALPQVDGDMRPSMLLDKMRALTPPRELEKPTSLFWYAFLSRLPPNICVHCVPFIGLETLADVARRAVAQFRARSRPAAPPQVCNIPWEIGEYGVNVAVQDAVNTTKARAMSPPQPLQLCYYHARFSCHALSAGAPAAGLRPRETPGAGIEEPPFLP